MSKFKKAEKKKSKLRLGISGPSGSGKTFSALRLAKGMGLKTAFIDSEKGSASLYSDRFAFDVLEIGPPYTTEKYQEAINDAIKEGYELIIADSISQAWAGEGGVLDQKTNIDARGGNSFTNWGKMTPKQEKFINAIVSCPVHIIVTMRSKQDHQIIDEGGKKKVQKVGLAPVQREGFEYELTTMFDVGINHDCETSKDRTGLFTDKIFRITESTGEELKSWLESGIEILPETIIKPEVIKPTIVAPKTEVINNKPIENKVPEFKAEEFFDAPPLFDDSEQMPTATELIPNLARGVYAMKGGRYHGLVIGKMNKIDLNKYVQSCIAHAQETQTTLPVPVVENICAIKEFLGMK